jgi:hypothetical protein
MSASESDSQHTPPDLHLFDCAPTASQPRRVLFAEFRTRQTALRERAFIAAAESDLVRVVR